MHTLFVWLSGGEWGGGLLGCAPGSQGEHDSLDLRIFKHQERSHRSAAAGWGHHTTFLSLCYPCRWIPITLKENQAVTKVASIPPGNTAHPIEFGVFTHDSLEES